MIYNRYVIGIRVDASTVEDPVLKAMKRDDPRCDNEGTELLAAKAASSVSGSV